MYTFVPAPAGLTMLPALLLLLLVSREKTADESSPGLAALDAILKTCWKAV